MTALFADTALLPDGWARHVRLDLTAQGDLAACTAGGSPDGAERLAGTVLPGMPNLHSHAFQRAMAGLTERAGGGDSFWSWREIMYGFLGRLAPADVRAIAAQLYVEMLKAGYTAVAEFHYLHHDPAGAPYAEPACLAQAIADAATQSGIGLTLLPTLYQAGGFGGAPPGAAQRRFLETPERLLRIIEALGTAHAGNPNLRLGLGLHSLRAVPPDGLAAAVAGMTQLDPAAPIHIHVAEQRREVEECLAWSGRRPVEWLLDHAALDRRWCLVHATHVTAEETQKLAASGAVAGLCPTTEANLGDGFFPFGDFLASGGRWGIGSDSHVSVSPVEELRWLEYGQRLLTRRRNLATGEAAGSTGAALWRAALAGGARALGRPVGALAAGCRCDLLVLADDAPALYGRSGDMLLDSVVFAGNANPIRDVMVGGCWLVRDGAHRHEDAIAAAYRGAIDRLSGDLT